MRLSAVAERKKPQHKKQPENLAPQGRLLRCMAYRERSGGYTAECIDLDLTARGDTPYAAMHSLKQAIVGYLHVAVDGDPTGLIPRRAPLGHRARYHWYAFLAALSIPRTFLVSDWSPPRSAA